MSNTTSEIRIGIITIATGRYYDEFIPELKKSVDLYLSSAGVKVQFYCFTDSPKQENGVQNFYLKHQAWPFSTLMRFHCIAEQMPVLEGNDFLLYMDADMKVVAPIPLDIFHHPLIAVKHPGFVSGSAPFELDRSDSAYVPPPLRKIYYQGCFWGGNTHEFKNLITQLRDQVEADLSNAAIPVWHDESYLNHYLASHNCFGLSPRFAWPEGARDGGMQPYVLHLEKPHNQIRQLNESAFDLNLLLKGEDLGAQLEYYKRLYLVSHEKCQRLELRLAHKNQLWLRLREWLSYYKNKNSKKSLSS